MRHERPIRTAVFATALLLDAACGRGGSAKPTPITPNPETRVTEVFVNNCLQQTPTVTKDRFSIRRCPENMLLVVLNPENYSAGTETEALDTIMRNNCKPTGYAAIIVDNRNNSSVVNKVVLEVTDGNCIPNPPGTPQ